MRHQEAARGTWEAPGRETQTLMTLRVARRSQEEPGGAQEEPKGTGKHFFIFFPDA